MWDPRIHDRLCDAQESDVRIANEHIGRLKKDFAATPTSPSAPNTGALQRLLAL
jgi:hypothetical protein